MVFGSDADNLVAGDANNVRDVFVCDAAAVATGSPSRRAATTARIGNDPDPVGSGHAERPDRVEHRGLRQEAREGVLVLLVEPHRLQRRAATAAWQYKYYFKPGMAKGYYVYKAVVPAWPGFLGSTTPNTVSIRLL